MIVRRKNTGITIILHGMMVEAGEVDVVMDEITIEERGEVHRIIFAVEDHMVLRHHLHFDK